MRFHLATFLKVVSIIAIILAVIASYRNYYQPHRTGVTAAIANRMMWPGYELPEGASDVTYYVDFGGCEAEFQIDETAFLAWCEHRGWMPVRIGKPLPYFQPVLLADDERPVRKGYTFNIPYGRGVFDAERSRAAFCASTFP